MIIGIIIICITCFYAYLFLKLIGHYRSITENIGLSYLIGLGCFTYFMFLLNWLKFSFSIKTGLLLIFSLTTLTLILNFYIFGFIFKKPKFNFSNKKLLNFLKRISFWQKILIFNLSFIFISVVSKTSYWPVSNWDSIVLYDYLAKQFASKGFIDYGLESAFLGYPFLVSLSHAWLYAFQIFQAGLIHSLFYISFLLVIFGFLKRKTSFSWSLIFTSFLALSSPFIDHAFMTYTNLAYSIYLSLSFIYFIDWHVEHKDSSALIAFILLSLSTWTRSIEPFWMLSLGLAVALALLSKNKRNIIILMLGIFLVLSVRFSWFSYKKQISQQMNFVSTTALQMEQDDYYSQPLLHRLNFQKVQESTKYFIYYILVPTKTYYLIFTLSGLIFIINYRKSIFKSELLSLFSIILINTLIIYMGIIYFSINYPDWKNIGGSATRMALFINPLILYTTALICFDLLKTKKRS